MTLCAIRCVFVLALILSFICAEVPRASAQPAPDSSANRALSVGPYFTVGASGSLGAVEPGTKSSYRTAWCFGALGEYPIGETTSLLLAFGYDSRGVNFYPEVNPDLFNRFHFGYITLQPAIKMKDYLVGALFGLPILASESTTSRDASFADFSTVNKLIEIRVGALYDLDRSANGDLRFLAFLGFPLTRIVRTNGLDNSSSDTGENNGPLVTVQIGLSFLFDLAKH